MKNEIYPDDYLRECSPSYDRLFIVTASDEGQTSKRSQCSIDRMELPMSVDAVGERFYDDFNEPAYVAVVGVRYGDEPRVLIPVLRGVATDRGEMSETDNEAFDRLATWARLENDRLNSLENGVKE